MARGFLRSISLGLNQWCTLRDSAGGDAHCGGEMKVKVMPPRGEVKVRISGLIYPGKEKETQRQQELCDKINANLRKQGGR
jgi:hypothetical protein